MHDMGGHLNQENEELCHLISQIEGIECIKVWWHLVDGQYHCVVRTGRTDLDRVVAEIQAIFRRKNLVIEVGNVFFTRTLPQIELPKARVKLVDYRVNVTDDQYSVDVKLKYLNREAEGHAEGVLDEDEKLRIACEATRNAVMELMMGRGRLAIKDVGRVEVKDKKIIVSLITLVYRGERIHCGAAINRADDCEAAIRATLDAVNRYLDILLGE